MKNKLMAYKKTYITLYDLEQFAENIASYDDFLPIIVEMVEANILQPVKSSGHFIQQPKLYNKYKINKHYLKQTLRQQIERLQLTIHKEITLDKYYRLTEQQFEQDLPIIMKISSYLLKNGLPIEAAAAPERSQQMVGDEKWLQYKGGRMLLERLGLWEKLHIIDVKEPLSFAVNVQNLRREIQYHLIVENKTTYEALLPQLSATCFSTLIYGAGYKIVGSMSLFEKQLAIPNVQHVFYYFGDIDFSGISIWHLLNNQREIRLAQDFYEAALKNEGKRILKSQYREEEAITAFLSQLNPEFINSVEALLDKKYYVSQEVLTAKFLKDIWHDFSRDLEDENGVGC